MENNALILNQDLLNDSIFHPKELDDDDQVLMMNQNNNMVTFADADGNISEIQQQQTRLSKVFS